MKITRLVHSCLLVETDQGNALFDPGVYSFESGSVDIKALPELSYLIITHEHPDHFHLPFVKELCERFPKLTIITTRSLAAQLAGKVDVPVRSASEGPVVLFDSVHEALPLAPGPENIGVHFAGQLTHPGDSHSFKETKNILAMPMTAPWGSMKGAIDRIKELKPKHVVPIHDWHYRPEALTGLYGWFKDELAKLDIDFIIPVDGVSIPL